jgi:Arc/MetJ family transcription regulator
MPRAEAVALAAARGPAYHTHPEVYDMRTNIVLDERTVKEAMRLTGAKTMREVVDRALRELVARRKQADILALSGKDLIAPDYDVRAVRRRMGRGSR